MEAIQDCFVLDGRTKKYMHKLQTNSARNTKSSSMTLILNYMADQSIVSGGFKLTFQLAPKQMNLQVTN